MKETFHMLVRLGLDLVVVFDVPDEIALRRAVGRTVGEKSGTQFHQEFEPPPEGVRTGVGEAEKVTSTCLICIGNR